MRAVKQLLQSVKKYRGTLCLAIIGILLTRVAEGGIYKYLIPNVLDQGFIEHNLKFFTTMPWLIIGIFFVMGLGEFLAKFFMGFVARSVVRDYRIDILQHLLYLPMKFYTEHTTGWLLSKVNYEAEQVAGISIVTEFWASIINNYMIPRDNDS